MSNVIPPMLSSTPPPMDDDNLESEEDDDEFGDFSTADLNYGMDISQASKLPINTLWIENDNHLPSSLGDSIHFKSDTSQHDEKQLILELRDSNSDTIEESDVPGLSGELQQDGSISQESVVPSINQTSPGPLDDRRSPVSCSSDETHVKSLNVDPDRTLPSISQVSAVVSNDLDHFSRQIDCEPVIQTVQDRAITDCDDRFSKIKPTPQSDTRTEVNDFTDFHSNFTEFQSECSSNSGRKHLSDFQCDVLSTVTLSSDLNNVSPGLNGQSSDVPVDISDRQGEAIGLTIDGVALSDDVPKQMPPETDFCDGNGFTLCVESDLDLVLEETDELPSVADNNWQSSVKSDTRESAIFQTSNSDSEFDDFTAFESSNVFVSQTDIPPKQHEEEDDEFSDFSSSAFTSTSFFPAIKSDDSGWATESQLQPPSMSIVSSKIDDDFNDFATATIPVGIHDQLSSHLSCVVRTLFPSLSEDTSSQEVVAMESTQPIVQASFVWQYLQDVDTSNALSYQWNTSTTNKMLLTSLGIDARNILFGPKWNISVPRFAANLGISPLEPMRASSPLPSREHPQPPQAAATHSEVVVPDAQFDWTSSGLVNPLDCVEKDGKRAATEEHPAVNDGQRLLNSGLSVEAAKLLDSLPDLSFLRAKSLVYPRHSRR